MTKEDFFNERNIGFMNMYPIIEGSTTIEAVYDTYPRGLHLPITVKLCKGAYGNNNQFSAQIVTTSDNDNRDKLWMGGWNQGVDPEIEARKTAVWEFCQANGLTICNVINSYPYERVIVTRMKTNS